MRVSAAVAASKASALAVDFSLSQKLSGSHSGRVTATGGVAAAVWTKLSLFGAEAFEGGAVGVGEGDAPEAAAAACVEGLPLGTWVVVAAGSDIRSCCVHEFE